MDKGVYCLVFRNPACTLRIGALGGVAFQAGWHIYTGSALGSGGIKRVDRHIGLARERDRSPKWHVDHLLTDPRFLLVYTLHAVTGDPLECRLARAIGGEGVHRFGCSDCDCVSHLLYRRHAPVSEISDVFLKIHLDPVIKTINTHDAKGNI